jgi:hypothetical protein
MAGSASRGFNPILILPQNQSVSLAIQSVAGVTVPANPTGALATPDVTIPAQQANPIPVVVTYAGIPLNTPITVSASPLYGPNVIATATADASGTATVSLTLPRAGGVILATAVVTVASGQASLEGKEKKAALYSQTGLTTDGETFAKMEITAGLGGRQAITYITQSGKRFPLPGN